MRLSSASRLVLFAMVGCTAPLTVARSREGATNIEDVEDASFDPAEDSRVQLPSFGDAARTDDADAAISLGDPVDASDE